MKTIKSAWFSIALFCTIFKSAVAAPELRQGSEERASYIRRAAQQMLGTINELENKSLGVRALDPFVQAWAESLETLKAGSFAVRDTYASIMARDQFKGFYNQFLRVSKGLGLAVGNLNSQEYDLEEGGDAQEKLAKAAAAVLGYLRALEHKKFFKNFEKLQTIYDKEAKVIREKQLQHEELARQQQLQNEYDAREGWDNGGNFFSEDYLAW